MKLKTILLLVILTLLSVHMTTGRNIIFLSLPFYGHLNPMVKTASELSKLGHTSYILISERYRTKFNTPTAGVKFVTFEESAEFLKLKEETIKFFALTGELSMGNMIRSLNKVSDHYLFNEKLFLTLKSLNASLAIVDGNFMCMFMAIFAHKLDIPFIFLGLHIQLPWHRTPWAPAVFPVKLFQFSDRMTFLQRLANFLFITAEYIYPLGIPSRSVQEYAPERPEIDYRDLMKKIELFIIDTDTYLDIPLPALPNVKYIGGLATGPAEPLQGDILEFVSKSQYGVVVVSPGSLVNWHGDHLNKLEEAFSKIKYDVVWKHSNSSYSRSNVLLTKWLPQNDLLGHPNTKLFITHCGNSGQYESLYNAVPMIGFPVFADQFFNCHRLLIKGFGLSMDTHKYSVDELVRNIEEVIENPKYKKNIAKVSEMFRSQKERPAEKAARHIDEIMKYGGTHLRSACQDIPLYQFLMLDIWAVLLLALLVFFYLIFFILRKCFRFVSRRKSKRE